KKLGPCPASSSAFSAPGVATSLPSWNLRIVMLTRYSFLGEGSGLLHQRRPSHSAPFDGAACSHLRTAAGEHGRIRGAAVIESAFEFRDAVDAAMGGIGGAVHRERRIVVELGAAPYLAAAEHGRFGCIEWISGRVRFLADRQLGELGDGVHHIDQVAG